MSKKVVVIDLDGTLIRSNSFRRWIFFILKKSFYIKKRDSIQILYIMLKRVLRHYSHENMKYKILQISESTIYESYIEEFVDSLVKDINIKVESYIDESNITILATAAPYVYVESFTKRLHFDYFICTPLSSDSNWFENIRGKKASSLKYLLQKLNRLKADLVLSDHHDDITIMQLANNIKLVNPSKSTLNIVCKNKIDIRDILIL